MSDAPDLSAYHAIHHAMRVTSRQLHAALSGMVEPDPGRADAVRRWFAGFTGEVLVHHRVEDEVYFPALAFRVPTYCEHAAELADGHHRLDQLLAGLGDALRGLAGGRDWDRHRTDAAELAAELRDLLEDHLDLEDRDVLPLFTRHFTAEEYQELDERARKAGFSVRQAAFTLPWLMASATADEQRHLVATAPSPLRLLWALTRRRYARLAARALGPAPASLEIG